MLGTPESYSETQRVIPVELKPLPSPKVSYDPVRFPQKGPKERWSCYTLNENASGKAIVFHDSFACSWYPYLGQDFREVVYIWHYDWDRLLIEQEKPDVVIDEILERFFNTENPANCSAKISPRNSTLLLLRPDRLSLNGQFQCAPAVDVPLPRVGGAGEECLHSGHRCPSLSDVDKPNAS